MTTNELIFRGKGWITVLLVLIVLSVAMLTVPITGTVAAVDENTYDDGPRVTDDELDDVWIGQELTLVDDGTYDGGPISIGKGPEATGDSDEIVATADYNADENSVTFETNELEAGEYYYIYAHGSSRDEFDFHGTTFQAVTEDLSVEFQSETVVEDGSTNLEIESERASQHVNVTSDSFDAEELEGIFGSEHAHPVEDSDAILLESVGDGDSFAADFEDIDLGEYEFTFDVTDSAAEDNATIEVTEDNEDYAFVDVDEPAQGDIANITLEVTDADTAAVVLGDGQDNFESAVELEEIEDEEVVLQFNTHVAASEDAWSVHEDSNASIADGGVAVDTQLEEGEAFPDHRWDLSVGDQMADDQDDDFELKNEFDRDVLSVQERADIGASALRTAPAAAELTDAESFEEATVTRTETVAEADALLLTVEEFGADGAVSALEESATLADAGLRLEIEEEDPGPVAEPHLWSTSADRDFGSDTERVDQLEVDLLNAGADEYDGDLHFLVTYESDSYERSLAAGDSYNATFTVTEDNAYVDGVNDEIERDLDFDLVERDLEWDAVSALPVTENATATGTTTVAPGTEFTATADSPPEEGGFIQRTDAAVTAGEDGDHEFDATFDFSTAEPGVRFDLIVEDSYAPDENTDVQESIELLDVSDPAPSAFEIDATAPTAVATGDNATLEVAVENTGDETATSNYSVVVDGTEVDADELELDAGDSTEQSYDLDTSTTGDIEWEVLTDSDDESGTVSVESDGDDAENGAATTEDEADTDDADDADDAGDGTPGFGIAVALVALLAVATLSLRGRT